MASKSTPKPDANAPVTPADVTTPDATAPETQDAPTVEESSEPIEPTLVQFRSSFEFAPPETRPQRIQFAKGRVVSSQEYDLDMLLKQGAQLDVVLKNDDNSYDVVADLNEL